MAQTTYEQYNIADRYDDWLKNHGKGVTPLFLSLSELARQLESKARKAQKQYPSEAKVMLEDAEACREEATRLREAAGIPMKIGWSTQGNVSGRDEHGKPTTETVSRLGFDAADRKPDNIPGS